MATKERHDIMRVGDSPLIRTSDEERLAAALRACTYALRTFPHWTPDGWEEALDTASTIIEMLDLKGPYTSAYHIGDIVTIAHSRKQWRVVNTQRGMVDLEFQHGQGYTSVPESSIKALVSAASRGEA